MDNPTNFLYRHGVSLHWNFLCSPRRGVEQCSLLGKQFTRFPTDMTHFDENMYITSIALLSC